jgi:hypothetical protein
MSVVKGQPASATVFNNAFVSKTVDSTVNANILLSDGKYIYLKGNATTDGSFRIGVDSDAIVLEKRIAGTWTTLQSFGE